MDYHFKTKKHKKRYVDSSSLVLVSILFWSWNCVWFLCSSTLNSSCWQC